MSVARYAELVLHFAEIALYTFLFSLLFFFIYKYCVSLPLENMLEPSQSNIEGSAGTLADGGEAAEELPWYVLWVRPRSEKAVRDYLVERGFEAFVASRHEVHMWRRGERRKVEKVLIPSIVFVRMNMSERRTVEDCPNVSTIMRDPAKKGARSAGREEYACITSDEMHLFRQMLGQEEVEVNFTTSDFSVGDYVRIKDFGEVNGKAQIVRIFGDKKTYVGLRVSFLGCAYMQMPLNRIIKI